MKRLLFFSLVFLFMSLILFKPSPVFSQEESSVKNTSGKSKTKKSMRSKRSIKRSKKITPNRKKEALPLLKEPAKISDRSRQRTNAIIDELNNEDPGSDRYIGLRLGTIQILSNVTGLETSPNKNLLSTGADINFRVFGNWYFETIYTKHLNTLSPSEFTGTPTRTLSDLYYQTLDIGVKYRFILDETKPSNYLGFRVMKHSTENNFELADPSAAIIINSYEGLSLGVEKGIPITNNLGISASLDMISINSITESSDFTVDSTGLGFVVRGELYYNLHFFGRKWRSSLAYWQSGMINEFSTTDRDLFERQNLVLTYRMISGALAASF